MNGTSTRVVGHHRTVTSMLRPGCRHKGWTSEIMCLWDDWSIQLLVLLGLIFQMVLAVSGSRRKVSSAETTRFVIWASYLLASYVATLALSELTRVRLNKSEEEYDTELKALLAPIILLQLGNPDSITAYSVEDNRLGLRRVLNLIITFTFVIWIVGRSWKVSIPMILYFTTSVAGIIKYGETIWALYSVYNENTTMNFAEEKAMFSALSTFPEDVPHRDIFLKAYFWFDFLKPHLKDWLKPPMFMSHRNRLIENYSPEDVFLTTEMELGFMYDVLYTKAPVLYTTPGITLRVIGYFSLLLTLGGFIWIFFDKHLRDPYVIYTFELLIGVVLLETYQLFKLFDSDWVIIKKTKQIKNRMVFKFLNSLVKRSLKKERWSNTMRQFNFLDFCLSDKLPWPFGIGILRVSGLTEKFKVSFAPTTVRIPMCLKKILLEDMEMFETKRDCRPFTKRGEWTLSAYESTDKLKWSIEMAFDSSVIIWHVATHICDYSCPEDSDYNKASKLISDYMMFLLVRHPSILSLTTAKVTFADAYAKFKKFLDDIPNGGRDRRDILKILSDTEYQQVVSHSEITLEPECTRGWKVVEDARRLARELKSRKDKWELISSVWVEMLCFAAYNCQQYHHAKLLRRGGEIITHVWLLLVHKTDKFRTVKYTDFYRELERR